MPTPDDYLVTLAELQSEFAAALRMADPDVPVPSCDDWSVGDLADHLAGVHHWAAAMARDEDEVPLPVPLDLVATYEAQAAELRETLANLGAEATGRILNGLSEDGRGPVEFWFRRQVHETLVHLWDIRSALGLEPPESTPELWADTVDEVLTVMYPRQIALKRTRKVVTRIELTATDTGQTWGIGAPNAVQKVAVSGAARDLALLLWGRLTPRAEGLTVTGDARALDDALTRAIVP
ncbi:maleylpyruvate isomerase family mycothiol-dependent enzyme [Nocardioides sp. YR527]|uniref:maleylpyruvate isomerase family mycothiol-dependent enzyme n=1 Tax=Nocardioides sp. YR527 TaxID=1881028 RepID=UPI001C40B719|nr:maleylpyruvate isomerase family mycothiol-dependent enzyme [Nocardioides sp. YR527]